MNKNDLKRFTEMITATLRAYGRDVSEEVILIWWETLREFPIEKIFHAIRTFGGEYLSPAAIRSAVVGKPDQVARRAFSRALIAVEKHGAYNSIVFDDPLISATIRDLGGWVHFCSMELNEWDERRFCERYQDYYEHGCHEAPVRLIGIHERNNGPRDRDLVLFGDTEKAKIRLESSRNEKSLFRGELMRLIEKNKSKEDIK